MKSIRNETGRDVTLTVDGKTYTVEKDSDFQVSDDPKDANNKHYATLAKEAESALKEGANAPGARVGEHGDLMVVRNSANTEQRVVPADRDRSAEVLEPQPGPVVSAVNSQQVESPHLEVDTVTAEEVTQAHKDNLEALTPATPDPAGSHDTSRINVSGVEGEPVSSGEVNTKKEAKAAKSEPKSEGSPPEPEASPEGSK